MSLLKNHIYHLGHVSQRLALSMRCMAAGEQGTIMRSFWEWVDVWDFLEMILLNNHLYLCRCSSQCLGLGMSRMAVVSVVLL